MPLPLAARLADAPSLHLDAMKRLWSVSGEVDILERVLASPSVDGLMKRRLEFKLGMAGAVITLERCAGHHRASSAQHDELLRETHRVRGALEVMEKLQTASETVTVVTAGQTEALRRKLAYLEGRLEAARKALETQRDAYHAAVRADSSLPSR